MKQRLFFSNLILISFTLAMPLHAQEQPARVNITPEQRQLLDQVNRFTERFSESYYVINANGRKLSESKSAAEAQLVAQKAAKLFKDAN